MQALSTSPGRSSCEPAPGAPEQNAERRAERQAKEQAEQKAKSGEASRAEAQHKAEQKAESRAAVSRAAELPAAVLQPLASGLRLASAGGMRET